MLLIQYDVQKSIRSTSYYARSRIESTPVHVPEQRTYPSYTTPVAVPVPCFAVAACPYVVKRVLNARNVKGSPRRAHTFEVLACSCSVLQCSNCFSASFQCLRGWFTRMMSENSCSLPFQEKLLANCSLFGRRGAYCQQSRRLEVPSSLPRDRHYSPCSWNRPSFEVDRPIA